MQRFSPIPLFSDIVENKCSMTGDSIINTNPKVLFKSSGPGCYSDAQF
jgi:hypothetical protein